MILYVNGDSHSVGHSTGSVDGMTINDDAFKDIGEAPHPLNLPHCYGAILAQKLGANLVNQSRSGGSLQRAIRLTKQFVYQNLGPLFVVIGVPSSEREEWFYQGQWYPIHAGGIDYLPQELHNKYKQWVADWHDNYDYFQRQLFMHSLLVDFDQWLMKHNVPHLFFNTCQCFDPAPEGRFPPYQWQGRFLEPYGSYDNQWMFCRWAIDHGYSLADSWGHFGKDLHMAWAELLYQHIKRHNLQ